MEAFSKEFVAKGYCVVKNAISGELLELARSTFFDALNKINGSKIPYPESLEVAMKRHRLSDIQTYALNDIQNTGIRKRLLLEKDVVEKFIYLIGPDLAYLRGATFAINVKGQTDHLYKKRWHQEMWSGGGVNDIMVWMPLVIDKDREGGLEFIDGSHKYGLIPNRNREPEWLPDNIVTSCPEIHEGDAVMFHSLTLHRTVANQSDLPRAALASTIRNFNHPFTGIEMMGSWTPFRFSPYATIRKILGNQHLTPFRTLGGKLQNNDDGLEDLDLGELK